jgi:hypothetical protein
MAARKNNISTPISSMKSESINSSYKKPLQMANEESNFSSKPIRVSHQNKAGRKVNKDYSIFKKIGVVTSVADGIVSLIGMSTVAYVKQLR